MAKVIGIGGVFFKARDKAALNAWYKDALGMGGEWGHIFDHDDLPADKDGKRGSAIWSPFSADTQYFAPSTKDYMVNLRVDDLDALLAHLKQRGDNVLDRRENTEQGKFGYVVDPEGTLLELWQPT